MITKETNSDTKILRDKSKEVKQTTPLSREEFLRDTISFDEFKRKFAEKMDERIGTNLCK